MVGFLCIGLFQKHLVDGPLLLRLDEGFACESLGLHHALQRRKLMRAVDQLKKSQVRNFKVAPDSAFQLICRLPHDLLHLLCLDNLGENAGRDG